VIAMTLIITYLPGAFTFTPIWLFLLTYEYMSTVVSSTLFRTIRCLTPTKTCCLLHRRLHTVSATGCGEVVSAAVSIRRLMYWPCYKVIVTAKVLRGSPQMRS